MRLIYKNAFFVILFLFVLLSLFTFFASPTERSIQFFGIDGRNTGLLLYFSLIVISLSGWFLASEKLLVQFNSLLLIVGLANVLYGLIQDLGLDPFDWSNPYSPVFGFFGNPNFVSAFIGIFSGVLWAIGFDFRAKIMFRIGSLLALIASIYVILKSDAQQGVLIFVLSGFIVVVIKLSKHSLRKYLFVPSILALCFAVIYSIFDILQKLPWESILYKTSVSNRGDLWRAAIRIANDNAITGVGFDGFDFYYREFRDLAAITERGNSTTSTSAHNVILDLLTSGGYPLAFIYIVLILFTFNSAIKVLKRQAGFNVPFTGLFVAWIAYQVQSLISINQIGLAVWGWALSGLIIGYEVKSRDSNVTISESLQKSRTGQLYIPLSIICVSMGLFIGQFPIAADIDFRSAVESREIEQVKDSAYKFPQSPQRMFYIATLFRDNNLNNEALQIAKDATFKFPRSYDNWLFLLNLEVTDQVTKEAAKRQLAKLDPLNPIPDSN
jgi:O-antigen ligase